MKFIQWNVWYKEDIGNILETLKEIDADVVCLQELTVNHPRHNHAVDDTVAFIAEGLSFNFFYQPAEEVELDGVSMNFGNAIFSRYPILNTDTQHIQKRAGVAGEDYADENRLYVEATIQAPSGPITIGTTHMSYTDRFVETPAKTKETDVLVDILKDKKELFVFSGDLNVVPDSYTIKSISNHLKHAGPSMDENTWTTKPFSYNGFKVTELEWRLDYCFTTPDVEIQTAKIIQTEYSDHLPIVLEIKY